MCHTIRTRLTCGHFIHGPIIQCAEAAATAAAAAAASASSSRSIPHPRNNPAGGRGTGGRREEICQPGITINTQTTACCDNCVTGFSRQFLESICRRCRRGVVHGMALAVLESLPRRTNEEEEHAVSNSSSTSSSSSSSSSSAAEEEAEYSHW